MTPEKFLKDTVELYCGDCLAVLDSLPENSVDAVLTDPPYHLTSIVQRFGSETAAPAKTGKTGAYARASAGFMGKKWDGGDIAFQPEVWAKVLRVLKPGAHLAAFGASRGYHRMACAIEDAGFEIRDSLMWVYSTGFPKSQNVAKFIDRELGVSGGRGGPRSVAHAAMLEKGTARRGEKHEGWDRPCMDDPEAIADANSTYMPASPQAQEFDGFGTALKPAFEPIVLARKPLGTGDIKVRENIEREIKSRGWTGEIKWQNEFAVSATHPNNSKASLKTRSSAETFAANAGAPQTTPIAPPTASVFESQAATGTLSTDRNISTQQSGDTANCETKSLRTTVASVHVAASANRISSPSTTSTGAEHNTENLSGEKFTQTFASEASPPGSERFAGIVTGLTDSMEIVHIRQEADSFVWPNNLPTFVPSRPLTVAANVLRWRTGALNIDACRVPTDEVAEVGSPSWGGPMKRLSAAPGQEGKLVPRTPPHNNGRWPANLVHDGSDEVVGAFPSVKARGNKGASEGKGANDEEVYAGGWKDLDCGERYNHEPAGTVGSAARFFYSAKADGDDRLGSKHPTVKPVDLLQYFSRLITPPGGVILDLFAGTGSLGEAAFREGFRAILIEREGEYQSDIRKRMKLVLGSSRERRVAAKSAKKAHDHGPLFS